MKDIFEFRQQLIKEYESFSRSFTKIKAVDIRSYVNAEYSNQRYWPEPLIQINPNYKTAKSIVELASEKMVHPLLAEIFQVDKPKFPKPIKLFTHQLEALTKAQSGKSYIVTTGTGSGKSLSFFIPIIDQIVKAKEANSKPKTRAIIIYPMNALANSQMEELQKFLIGFDAENQPFTVARYTGQESASERQAIADNPPDILLTNFMMLELIMTRFDEVDKQVVENCQNLSFLVMDELHTYRGRQGADVAMLVRRLKERMRADNLLCIGTSATMSSTGTEKDQKQVIAGVASKLFATNIHHTDIIGETLERITDDSKDIHAVTSSLASSINRTEFKWHNLAEFKSDPLAIWIELTLGISYPEDGGAPKRAKPISLS